MTKKMKMTRMAKVAAKVVKMAKVTKMTKMLEIMETKYDEDVKDVEDKNKTFSVSNWPPSPTWESSSSPFLQHSPVLIIIGWIMIIIYVGSGL